MRCCNLRLATPVQIAAVLAILVSGCGNNAGSKSDAGSKADAASPAPDGSAKDAGTDVDAAVDAGGDVGDAGWACTSHEPLYDASNGGWVTWENSGCNFGRDDTHFVGMNYSGGSIGAFGNTVGQDLWSAICATASGAIVGLNDSTCVTRETQLLQANSAQDFLFTNNAPKNPTGAVTSYPNAGTYAYTGVVDKYTTLKSTYSQSMPINAHTSAWAMQDDWLTEPGNKVGDFTYEIMIQYDFTNNGDCPSTYSNGNWGVVANNVMIDGVAWHVCDGQATHQADGTCPSAYPGCGAMVWKLGATEADRPSVPSNSGTLDLKAMIQWLETHNVPGQSYPFVQPGASVAAISEGWEIASTGGVPEQFRGSGFTITAVGGAAP